MNVGKIEFKFRITKIQQHKYFFFINKIYRTHNHEVMKNGNVLNLHESVQ